jgi:GH24 family phage-related lysozyme (muramidase)
MHLGNVTKSPVKLSDLFRYYRHGTPHQMAAITELEAALLKVAPDAFNRDQPWFKTWSQAGKQPDPIYLAPAERIIKQWEGCKLIAYPDPGSGGDPWTIGWGATRINGAPVRQGDKISQELADELLRNEIHHVAGQLHKLIPITQQYGANQQAALISWAYNVGLGAVEDSTLRKRLLACESGQVVIPQELPRWNKAGNREMQGLTNRRAAEVALFTGTTKQQSAPRFAPSSPFTTLVTPHITYGELCLGEERRRFANQAQCDIATELCTFLEKARAQFGNKPLIITSGHRPPAVNQAVGGASNSEHLYKPGCGAVDWYISGVPVQTVQNWCVKNWPYSTGLGAPKGFIHTGIRAGRPRVVWDY